MGTPQNQCGARELCAQLVTNERYQAKLRRDFERRKVHPTVENLVWAYHLGKPNQSIDLTGSVALNVSTRIEQERAAFAALDLHDLELLAAESQRLVDRAFQLAKMGETRKAIPQDVVVEANQEDQPSELLGITSESNKGRYVAYPESPSENPIKPHDTEG